jgi:hypothetical protein
MTPKLRQWYRDAGFAEVAFEPIEGSLMSVGTYRFEAPPQPFRPEMHLFEFVPQRQLGPGQRQTWERPP